MTTCSNCGHQADEAFRFCPACGTRLLEGEVQDLLLGRILNGKYRVVSEIGAGAMGRVYLGEHIGLKKKVALKVLHRDMQVSEESLRRFQREGIAAGQFSHPNAIQIFDFDKDQSGVFYLAMEFVEGQNLKVYLRGRGRLGVEEATELVRQVLSALAEAHRCGIVHRDLKPDNIMVTPGSGVPTVKVLDFGLSKLIDRPLEGSMQTQVGRILGTPLYMAPEQCAGEEADHRADLYAVGLVFYELLTGITAFPDESTSEILYTRPRREAPSIADSHPDLGVSTSVDGFLRHALQRRREERFQTAEEMLEALSALDGSGPVGGTSVQRWRPSGGALRTVAVPGGRRTLRRGLLAGAVVAVLAVLVAGAVFFNGRSSASAFARVSEKPVSARTDEERRYVVLLEEARSALLRGNPDSAWVAIQDARARACADSEAYLLRGDVSLARNEIDAALQDYQEALARDPEYVAALVGMGQAYLGDGQLGRARERFEAALALRPDDAAALAGAGGVCLRHGALDDASVLLERALAADAECPRAQLYYGELRLAQGDEDEAIEALTRARRAGASGWELSTALGEAYLADGDLVQAESHLRAALQENVRIERARTSLASLLIETDRSEEARGLLAEGLRATPDAGQLEVLLGATYQEEEDLDRAVRALRRGLVTAPHPRGHQLLGVQLQRLGRHEDALAEYERALALDETLGTAHLDRGLCLVALGRYAEARGPLTRAVELAPDDPFPHKALGALLWNYLGEREEGELELRRFRELGGRDEAVDALLR